VTATYYGGTPAPESVLPLQVIFWGERHGQLRDPLGVLWSIRAGERLTHNLSSGRL